MKDRIGNKLELGHKVAVALPDASIFGFIAQIEEGGLITGLKRGGSERRPGRVLVSCVIALPVDPESGAVPQLVRVHDPDKHEEAAEAGKPN